MMENFYVNLDLVIHVENRIRVTSFASVYQIFERPTQRPVSISPLFATEGKKAPPCMKTILTGGKLHGCGLAALAYKSKTYESLFCGLFGQIYIVYENLHQ